MASYVLLHKKTGKPLHVNIESNDGKDDCNSFTCRLSDYSDDPLYIVDDVQDAIQALYFDVAWYNSDPKHPMLDRFKREDLEIVEMIVAYQKVQYDEPLTTNDCLNTRDIPYILAKKFVDYPIDKDGKYVLVQIKKDTKLTLAELQKYVGKKVYFGSVYNGRKVFSVFPAREEYADEVAFEMVCSLTA